MCIRDRPWKDQLALLDLQELDTKITKLVSRRKKPVSYTHLTGPNTGGMGTFAPNPFYTDERQAQFERDILAPTLKGIQAEGLKFAGCIFFGLMLTDNGTYLLEYNMRFGDPETQVVLPLLDSDLYSLLTACMQRTLTQEDIKIRNQKAICLVLASGGYPGDYQKGKEITGLDGVDYLEAGVRHENGKSYTNGGRVLNLSLIHISIFVKKLDP